MYHHKDEFSVNRQSIKVCLFVLHQVEVSTNDIHICTSDITIQHMASFYGYRGGKGNLGKTRVIVLNDDTWMDKLASVKSFIVTKGRMPSRKAGDVQ